MIQITKSAKGSKIDSLRFNVIKLFIDNTNINSVVEKCPDLGQDSHALLCIKPAEIPAI
jgi:hypothetical protein